MLANIKNKKIVLAIVLVLLSFFSTKQSGAHGIGTPVKINVPSDPYLLSIWTDPDPLRVDETHVTVAVMKPETQEPIVAGVEVLVQLQSSTDPIVTRTTVASPDNSANRLLYAAIFTDLPEPGLWQGIVSVVGPDGPGKDIPFSVEILPLQSINWLRYGIISLLILVFGWFIWSAWKTTSRDQSITATIDGSPVLTGYAIMFAIGTENTTFPVPRF